jgi:hypothetical protein
VLQDLVRLEAAVPRAGQRQALQALLVEREADRLVPEVARRRDHEGRHQDERDAHAGQRGASGCPPVRRHQRYARQRGHPQIEAEDDRQAGQRAGQGGPAPRQQQPAERERERRGVGVRDARVRHRRRHGQPGAERQRLGRVAAHERVGEHRDPRVEQNADDPPREQRRAEQPVETPDQEVLAGPVVGVEIAVRQLAVGDALARLQHQPLVVRVDAPPDRQARQQRAEQEQDHGDRCRADG